MPEPTPTSPENLPKSQPEFFARAAEKVRAKFPQTPGVYLMQDHAGRVIYIGKAKNLRARAGSYFLKAAANEDRTRLLVKEIYDIDYLDAESEVDALLMESRLIKDIQPKYNRELRDDKSFPYLQITTHEDFPRVEVTREPKRSAVKLYGPFASAGIIRGAVDVLQRVFKFRTCSLDIREDDPRWRWFRPCLLASIEQCSAPCNLRISKEEYRRSIRRLRMFIEGNRKKVLAELQTEMEQASANRCYEQAAQLRDQIEMLQRLRERGDLEKHEQPEVFPMDPKKGVAGLQQILRLKEPPRTIEGVDIAHLSGSETVASLVQFIDGMPFKPGYRRYRIREVNGVDDYASIHEVITRRYAGIRERESDSRVDADRPYADQTFPSKDFQLPFPECDDIFPDVLLIDGGKGQLHRGLDAFETLGISPPLVLSLAKKEELVYVMHEVKPRKLSRHAYALRLLQYIRDEAHRFAQHYHHILRRKKTLGE
ncbi:MAG: excinuclease ABC subunit UvrC [Pirellulales bacterium]|nr:excinuclease ABC subunit UvrC [Pirellulales bacterium]